MFRSQGFMSARALRMGGGLEVLDELEALIAQTWAIQQRLDAKGWMPLLLMERAGLAKLRGDTDGMKRDLAEVRSRFAEMGVTGWNDYARSIEA